MPLLSLALPGVTMPLPGRAGRCYSIALRGVTQLRRCRAGQRLAVPLPSDAFQGLALPLPCCATFAWQYNAFAVRGCLRNAVALPRPSLATPTFALAWLSITVQCPRVAQPCRYYASPRIALPRAAPPLRRLAGLGITVLLQSLELLFNAVASLS